MQLKKKNWLKPYKKDKFIKRTRVIYYMDEKSRPPYNTLILVAILTAAILIVAAFSMGWMMNNDQQINPNQKTLSTSATINKKVAPDKVEVVINIETQNNSAQISQEDNARISAAVRQALTDIGVTDVKTLSYYENEQYVWNSSYNRQDKNGYITVNSLQINLIDITKAGSTIDAAVRAGANRVQSVSYTLTDSKQNEIKAQALEEASASAKLKAISMAKGLGVTLGSVVNISESSFNYYPMMKTMGAEDISVISSYTPPTQITPGDVTVDASVVVVFGII
jgi:uncharacterized protein